MRTIYSRMVELALVQRASMLRFLSEVTRVSNLCEDKQEELTEKISSIYKEYIRFINQVYFREVTAQDQGIELYNLLLQQFNSEKQIEYLESEIRDLYQYVSIVEEHKQTRRMERFTWLATIFVPASLFTGILGMNSIFGEYELKGWHLLCHLAGLVAIIWATYKLLNYF